ncbi:PIN domain-like protein [Coniophora puteana RWD-64-598 SS2]|uniref:PIN domain-like protein n=1 Tax=Coniophora puteana (strain RWD-64-598) TaxID=741705 RepID=A0A5M3M8E8_CONPW|nr:PIN domain-like protein [Coniophora puteana RWD-64-598 SS2]EIW75317.1 PIN domain-like protein [Coniophora puteana RWD-64-598 SS2]
MYAAAEAIRSRHINSARIGQCADLKILVNKLSDLLRLPVHPLFVFDGSERPTEKRGKHVDTENKHQLEQGFKDFIQAYGFNYHTAPGEAEAELAAMNRMNHVDGVLTSDSDVVLFGAGCIIRDVLRLIDGDDNKKHQVEIHTEESIRASGWNSRRLLLVALLSGADYDMGCGIGVASQLAKSELGEKLVQAYMGCPAPEFLRFCTDWRRDLRDMLRNNTEGTLTRKHGGIADNVRNTFPSLTVLGNYLCPVTSHSLTLDGPREIGGLRSPQSRQPNVTEAVSLFKHYFNWPSAKVEKYIRDNVWSGIYMRAMFRVRHTGCPEIRTDASALA